MAFFTGRQFHNVVAIEGVGADFGLFIGHRDIVDPAATGFDQAPGFAVGCCQAGLGQQREHGYARRQIVARNFDCRQGFGNGAILERLPRGFRSPIGCLGTV